MQDGDLTETGSARPLVRRGTADVEARRSLQPTGRPGLRQHAEEGEAALQSGLAAEAEHSSGRGQGEDRQAHRLTYVPAHLHHLAEDQRRGCESDAGAVAARDGEDDP
jgi:hypothetical protein